MPKTSLAQFHLFRDQFLQRLIILHSVINGDKQAATEIKLNSISIKGRSRKLFQWIYFIRLKSLGQFCKAFDANSTDGN